MVDWRGARVGQSALSMRKSVGWYLEREGNGVRNNHPARKWVEDQEARMVGEHASRTPGAVRECAEDLGRVMNQRMGEDDTSGDPAIAGPCARARARESGSERGEGPSEPVRA